MTTEESMSSFNVGVNGNTNANDIDNDNANNETNDMINESFSLPSDTVIKPIDISDVSNIPSTSFSSSTYAKIGAVQKNVTTMACSQCNQECSQSGHLLSCNKCSALAHFQCSNLPSYCLGLLKSLNKVYVCERCAEGQEKESSPELDTIEESYAINTADIYTRKTTPNTSTRSNETIRTLRDIQLSLKEITEEMESAHMENMTESLLSIDEKIETLETRIEEKLKNYLNRKLIKHSEEMIERLATNNNIFHSSRENAIKNKKSNGTCQNCSRTEQELKTKDSAIELLKSEISEKNKIISKLESESEGLLEKHRKRSEDMTKLNVEVEEYIEHPRSTYVEQLKEYIKILELQISVNNGQNEMLTVAGQQKDSKLVQLRNQIRSMGTRLGKVVEEAAQIPDLHLPQQQMAVNQPNQPTNQLRTQQQIRRNHTQSHSTNVYTPYFSSSSSMENSQGEDVMLFDGSVYQRLGHLQQG